jgi:outer membrane murein-binding lipoprotein Lpp
MSDQIKKIRYHSSPLWVAAAVMTALLTAGVAYYYFDASKANTRKKTQLTNSNRTLKTAVDGLAPNFSDQRAQTVRDSATKIKAGMMNGTEADMLVSSLRPTWTVLSRSEESNTEYIHRRYQIARGTAPVSTWPEIQSLLDRLGKTASLAVNSIDIQTVGDSRKREFSRVTIAFSIYIRKPPGAETPGA